MYERNLIISFEEILFVSCDFIVSNIIASSSPIVSAMSLENT